MSGWSIRLLSLLVALLLPVLVQAQTNCRKSRANLQNNGADIVVSSTPVTVLEANTGRCTAVIYNTSTANDMRCRDVTNDGVPSATAGYLVSAGKWLTLGLEGGGRWQCIRVGAADTAASVLEDRP